MRKLLYSLIIVLGLVTVCCSSCKSYNSGFSVQTDSVHVYNLKFEKETDINGKE